MHLLCLFKSELFFISEYIFGHVIINLLLNKIYITFFGHVIINLIKQNIKFVTLALKKINKNYIIIYLIAVIIKKLLY
jgi:tRNA G37 N-methylase Trm5